MSSCIANWQQYPYVAKIYAAEQCSSLLCYLFVLLRWWVLRFAILMGICKRICDYLATLYFELFYGLRSGLVGRMHSCRVNLYTFHQCIHAMISTWKNCHGGKIPITWLASLVSEVALCVSGMSWPNTLIWWRFIPTLWNQL